MTKSAQTVGEFLFDYLHSQCGIKTAFGIPGDFALPTFRWLERSKMKLITMTHEPSVGFAADAYARVNGMGVAIVTYCVGGLNMLNSIACAYAEKSPVLVISGGPSPKDREQNEDALIHHKVRTFDTQRHIYEEVTCANAVLLDPATAADEIVRVVETMKRECRPGYIEVPFDVVDMPITPPSNRSKLSPIVRDQEALDACIEEAVEFINKAKQPVILAGIELHRHNLTDNVIRIAEKFNLPIAADLLSKSVVRETHPLYIGVYSGAFSEQACREYIDNSDCVIMLGTFITDMFLGINTAQIKTKRSILITTEEARVGFHGYEKIQLQDVVERLESGAIADRGAFKNPCPAPEIKPLAKENRGKEITIEKFFNTLEHRMEEGSTLVCDTGDAVFGAMRVRTSKRRNFLADAYYLSMGFAVPGAIGAIAESNPQDSGRVFAIVGDGAFQMTGMEVSVAAKYKLAPVVFVLNNDGYGTQRYILDGSFNIINMWDYTKVTELMRYGRSVRVKTLGELDDTLVEIAKNKNEMYLVEVIIPRNDCSPALKSVGEGLAKLRNKEAHPDKA
ncbi:MAG: alpha-keto acid decarboxylase family protein [Alphaproteobacteria bacterium]|nr:alpha-keto acid decarboxylase family protein [Alphaproteobacteria bacterium]